MDDLIARLKEVLGPKGWREGDDIGEVYRVDEGRMRVGDPALVMCPTTTEEVAGVLALCNRAGRAVVAQGGMTGLVDAAVPGEGELVLTLERMRKVVELDDASATLTVEAGAVLQAVQEYADEHGFLFPLDIGARGSCTIGGVIATNAGGNRVIRYGMMRDMVLGIEAVLADGTVLSGLSKMIKNNAGYDLKHLFIGTEGTLGVVTRAVLRLRPKPRSQSVAFCALTGFEAATKLLRYCHEHLGGTLSAFEAFWPSAYTLVLERVPGVRPPLADGHPFYVLIESMGSDPEGDGERFDHVLAGGAEKGWLVDAVVAKSQAEVVGLWSVRDAIPEALFTMQPLVNFDIGLALGDMEPVARRIVERLDAHFPDHRTVFFGHIGDGNLHLSLTAGADSHARQEEIDEIVYGVTAAAGGSISAEHGIGRLKRGHLDKSRSAAEIALMRTLKATLDPNNILSPGRVLDG